MARMAMDYNMSKLEASILKLGSDSFETFAEVLLQHPSFAALIWVVTQHFSREARFFVSVENDTQTVSFVCCYKNLKKERQMLTCTLASSSLSFVEHFPQCLLCRHQLVHPNHAPQIRALRILVWYTQYCGTYS